MRPWEEPAPRPEWVRDDLVDVPASDSPAAVPREAVVTAGVELGSKTRAEKSPPVSRDEVVSERGAAQRVFTRSDGLREVELFSQPRYFESANGEWEPIDSTVVDDAATSKGLRSKANSWTARFAPVTDASGVRFETATGAVVMVPVDAGAVHPAGLGQRYLSELRQCRT